MRKLKEDKKGILGLETVRVVIVTLLILAVITIASFLALTSLQTPIDTIDAQSATITNESGGFINITGYTLTDATKFGFKSPVITLVVNTTANDGTVVLSGNYTVDADGIVTNASVTNYASVNISYTYSFLGDASEQTTRITGNMTSGTTQFFANVPTYMILLGVIVLLLIIAIVLVVVGRFGESSTVRTGGSELTGGGTL